MGWEFTKAASCQSPAALWLRSSSGRGVRRFLCHLPSPLSTKLVIVLADLEDWKKLALMPNFSAME